MSIGSGDMSENKIRIALVNQRYGLEVNGGSEYYTRQLAEHLKDQFDVEVLTTKALGYETWEDYYPSDLETINGVTVRRFSVTRKRNLWGMRIWGRLQRYCPFFGEFMGRQWINAQGPYSPGLIQYIETHKNEYKIFIFVTYLYYHTVKGIPAVSDKAVLLPTAHDEPYIYFPIFRRIFTMPRALIYLTPEEKSLVESLFHVEEKPNCVAGAGVELPEHIDNEAYRRKFDITQDYVIYVGRIEPSKGCDEMFRIFQAYKRRHPDSRLKLVLMGKAMMDIPTDDDILYQGFVSEEDKFNGISGARALWLPSWFESLSIAVLEAMSLGVPVIVNGKCQVLKGHCERSKAGVYYGNEKEAVEKLDMLIGSLNTGQVSEMARKYVEKNYQWETIIHKIDKLIMDLI